MSCAEKLFIQSVITRGHIMKLTNHGCIPYHPEVFGCSDATNANGKRGRRLVTSVTEVTFSGVMFNFFCRCRSFALVMSLLDDISQFKPASPSYVGSV